MHETSEQRARLIRLGWKRLGEHYGQWVHRDHGYLCPTVDEWWHDHDGLRDGYATLDAALDAIDRPEADETTPAT